MRRVRESMDDFYKRLKKDGYRPEDISPALRTVEKSVRLEQIRRYILACQDCPLCERAKNRVPGTGNTAASIVIVGEGPGEDEEAWGLPLVGISGSLLTLILEKVGLPRESLYLTNVVKCRVNDENGRNRTPLPDETMACRKFLRAELSFIQPKVIVALGKVALNYFFPEMKSIMSARGKTFSYEGMIVVPTWHPSYILRQRGEELIKAKKEAWHDFILAKKILTEDVDIKKVQNSD